MTVPTALRAYLRARKVPLICALITVACLCALQYTELHLSAWRMGKLMDDSSESHSFPNPKKESEMEIAASRPPAPDKTTKVNSYPPCQLNPKEFVGRISVSSEDVSIQELEKKFSYLRLGGHYVPEHCRALSRIAVIVPFLDREEHLRILLNHMHQFLTKQQLDYAIIVVEPVANQTFNRAKLFNVGYLEVMKMYDWECFLFHDVDVLPEDDRNLHTCPTENPRHMAVAMNKFNYKLAYDTMFGTSSALTVQQFEDTNGFSNRYWGWGGEDDDMYTRVRLAGYRVDRYNSSIARYTMIKHGSEKANPVNACRFEMLKRTEKDWKIDGLNSLSYKLIHINFKKLYTHILVDLLESKERFEVEKRICKNKDLKKLSA